MEILEQRKEQMLLLQVIESKIILGRNQKIKIVSILEKNGKIRIIMETEN